MGAVEVLGRRALGDDRERWEQADPVAAWGQAIWAADLEAATRLRDRLGTPARD